MFFVLSQMHLPPTHCLHQQLKLPKDLVLLFRETIADMERLAGVSPAFQGVAPKGVTAGVAIQTLAENSARRVNRMASHMAESLRFFGKMWAAYELAKRGMELPPRFKVKVTLAVQEEQNRRDQFQKIRDIAEVWDKLPAEILDIIVDSIPGLTQKNKRELMTLLEKRKEMEQRAQEAQQAEREQALEAQQGEPGAPQLPAPTAPEGGGALPAPAQASSPMGSMGSPGAPPAPRSVPDFLR